MPRSNTIAQNQNYVTKIIRNPKTSPHDREAVIGFVLSHPDRFTPFPEFTDDPIQNELAAKRNGPAVSGFMKEFRRRYM